MLPSKSEIATSCDKLISLWDMNFLSLIGTLKDHKDEIETLNVYIDILYNAS